VFSPEGAPGVGNAHGLDRGQSSPYGNGPFRAHSVGELTQGKPWASMRPTLSRLAAKIVFFLSFLRFRAVIKQQLTF
jgi:hypothetical protein